MKADHNTEQRSGQLAERFSCRVKLQRTGYHVHIDTYFIYSVFAQYVLITRQECEQRLSKPLHAQHG